MNTKWNHTVVLPAIVGIVVGWTSVAAASPWGKVVQGLSLIDFQLIAGRENYLGKGYTMVFDFPGPLFRQSTNLGLETLGLENLGLFNTTYLDVGLADLTINNEIITGVSLVSRIVPAISFSSQNQGGPLTYSFRSRTGLEQGPVTGQITVDNRGFINLLGAYELHIAMSGRGTDPNTGQNLDFDIGPVDVSGNLFLDILSGTNPFDRVKQAALANAEKNANERSIRSKAAAGTLLSEEELDAMITAALSGTLNNPAIAESLIQTMLNVDSMAFGDASPGRWSIVSAVPEPATIGLLGLGMLGFLYRPRRVR